MPCVCTGFVATAMPARCLHSLICQHTACCPVVPLPSRLRHRLTARSSRYKKGPPFPAPCDGACAAFHLDFLPFISILCLSSRLFTALSLPSSWPFTAFSRQFSPPYAAVQQQYLPLHFTCEAAAFSPSVHRLSQAARASAGTTTCATPAAYIVFMFLSCCWWCLCCIVVLLPLLQLLLLQLLLLLLVSL